MVATIRITTKSILTITSKQPKTKNYQIEVDILAFSY